MTTERDFNLFNCFICFVIGFMCGLLFNIHVYAATPWNENNNFDDINSMTQFTTLNDILSDSSYTMDRDGILDFINNSKYDYKYIVSYCNSADCSLGSTNRSIDLIGFNDPIKMKVSKNDNCFNIKFLGPDGAVVDIFDHSQIWGGWGKIYLTSTNNSYDKSYFYGRSVFDVSYYTNFDTVLPNYFTSDTLFKGTNFLEIYNENLKAFKNLIIFFIVVFIVICLICKKFGIFLTPINRGGGKW